MYTESAFIYLKGLSAVSSKLANTLKELRLPIAQTYAENATVIFGLFSEGLLSNQVEFQVSFNEMTQLLRQKKVNGD